MSPCASDDESSSDDNLLTTPDLGTLDMSTAPAMDGWSSFSDRPLDFEAAFIAVANSSVENSLRIAIPSIDLRGMRSFSHLTSTLPRRQDTTVSSTHNYGIPAGFDTPLPTWMNGMDDMLLVFNRHIHVQTLEDEEDEPEDDERGPRVIGPSSALSIIQPSRSSSYANYNHALINT